MSTYGAGQYRQTQVTTVDKGRLIVLLYEGAIKFLREAAQAQADGDIPAKARLTNRALDIIDELSQSLNMQEGGEVAVNLKRLYVFWGDHLLKGKVARDSRAMEDVAEMMSSLVEAWRIICSSAEGAKVATRADATATSITASRTV